jgi:hypothetical protein
MSLWNLVVDWFRERNDRQIFMRDFNNSAKMAYLTGQTDILLKASISYGNSNYRHAFSKFMAGGFRIKAEGGRPLGREEVMSIGNSIIGNPIIVRTMITLGWDTLEVHPSNSSSGLQWRLQNNIYLS